MTETAITVRACVFDAYGTLFDFASAAARCADVLGDKTAAVTALWRDKQLQCTWLRGLQGRTPTSGRSQATRSISRSRPWASRTLPCASA